jgi:hypothetical protein
VPTSHNPTGEAPRICNRRTSALSKPRPQVIIVSEPSAEEGDEPVQPDPQRRVAAPSGNNDTLRHADTANQRSHRNVPTRSIAHGATLSCTEF